MSVREFDADFYFSENSDVEEAIENGTFSPVAGGDAAAQAYEHFRLFGDGEGRDPNASFSTNFYKDNNPDVADAVESGMFPTAFEHFQAFGAREQRLPSEDLEDFDEDAYLATWDDVDAAVQAGTVESGLQHYLLFGSSEGREAPMLENDDDAPDDDAPADEDPVSSSLADKIREIEPGGWGKLNENAFEDVWPEGDLGAQNGSPAKVIHAWSSMAWDSNRGDLIFWGGGHANYTGNEVYRWDSDSMLWERASLPSAITNIGGNRYETVDGVMNAPISSHTYDNNAFLPMADKFVTLGGADYNVGGGFRKTDGDGGTSSTGPYFWDPELADPNKVGGETGSHVNPESNPDIVGGNMWENRDSFQYQDEAPSRGFVNGTTAYAEEDGKDVLYVTDKPGSDSKLWKYTVHDVDDPSADTWEIVGSASGFSRKGSGAFAEDLDLFVRAPGETPSSAGDADFVFWDLGENASHSNARRFAPNEPTGEFDPQPGWGIDYDSNRKNFVLWDGNEEVWSLTPPETSDTGGWELQQIALDGQEGAPTECDGDFGRDAFRGVMGKWEYVEEHDVFLGVIDPVAGDVWAFKPPDNQDEFLIA